jgi:hypothetical protein
MLVEFVDEFDEQLPEKLTYEDTFEVGAKAWNSANNKEFLDNRHLYRKELRAHEHPDIIDKMVDYKLEKFPEFDNIILEFETEGNKLRVTTQTPENHFNAIMENMIKGKPAK